MTPYQQPHPIARHEQFSELARRGLDLAIAVIALVLLSPIIILISIAILIETGAPIIFTQTRLGRNHKPFKIYKFRKFRPDCGTSGLALTLERDQRMTAVGLVLQSTKLDELPQFWNVIEGTMSIVGPRPEAIAFADCFQGELEQILHYKPGLLGPTQVMFRNESRFFTDSADPEQLYRTYLFPLKGHIDLEYYRRRTLAGDLRWILLGTASIVRGE